MAKQEVSPLDSPSRAIPYLASRSWYAAWIKGLLAGQSDFCARTSANRVCGAVGKIMSRAALPVPDGSVAVFSVPICGGASSIKKLEPEQLIVSDHGRWPHIHLGALEAAFGSAPFFRHLHPFLEEALLDAPGAPLSLLTERLHRASIRMLGLPRILDSLSEISDAERRRFRAIAADIGNVVPDSSRPLLETLVYFGPDTIFSLL